MSFFIMVSVVELFACCVIPMSYFIMVSVVEIFAHWLMFHAFVVVCRLFSKQTFSNNYFRNNIRVSNGLDPHQDRHSVGPDLGLNCLQRLSADKPQRSHCLVSLSKNINSTG